MMAESMRYQRSHRGELNGIHESICYWEIDVAVFMIRRLVEVISGCENLANVVRSTFIVVDRCVKYRQVRRKKCIRIVWRY